MTTEEKRSYLEKMHRQRGYILDMHKILVSVDFDWLQAYDPFAEATYTGQRLLDRKTKELLQIVVEAALRADVEQIQAHVELALKEGATPQEVLEALQTVVMPMGMLAPSGEGSRPGPRRSNPRWWNWTEGCMADNSLFPLMVRQAHHERK